jgi:hypothetical protein
MGMHKDEEQILQIVFVDVDGSEELGPRIVIPRGKESDR